jgi:hypothetical protein
MLLESVSDEQPDHSVLKPNMTVIARSITKLPNKIGGPPFVVFARVSWSEWFAANARDRAREMQNKISKFPRRMSS